MAVSYWLLSFKKALESIRGEQDFIDFLMKHIFCNLNVNKIRQLHENTELDEKILILSNG